MNGLQQQQQQQVPPNMVLNDCLSGGDICNINGNLEPPTIENISSALVALYTSTDTCMRDYAQQWLIKIQTLSVAWDFCPQLLETTVLELQFFGASTLEQKLKNEWNTLPNEMKQRVLSMVTNIAKNSTKLYPIVATKVCVVLSIVAMYTYSTLWTSPIENVIQLCSQNIDQPLMNIQLDNLRLVLEFLSILPQELRSGTISCQYKVIKKGISVIIDRIYNYLLVIMQMPIPAGSNFDAKVVIRAQSNWLSYMLPTNPSTFLSTFDTVLKATIANPNQVISFMHMVDSTLVHLENKISEDIEKVFDVIADRLQVVMPEFFQRAVQEEDFAGAKSICHLFVQILLKGNSVLSKELIKRYLELLVSFISVGNREFCELLFPLFDDFKSHPEFLALDKSFIDSFFLKVLNQICLSAVFPTQKSAEEYYQIQTFRDNSTEMLDVINRFTMSDRQCFVNHLIEMLNNDIVNKVQQWQRYEVTLYYISAFACGSKNSKVVPAILNLLPSIPAFSVELSKTSITLIGKCANYLQDNKESLEKVVSDIIPAFACSDLLKASTHAFLSITANRKCSLHLAPNACTIIDLCTPHLKTHQAHPSVVTLYESLLYIIHVISSDKMLPPFKKLIVPVVEDIRCIISSEQPSKGLPLLKIHLQVIEKLTNIIDIDDSHEDQKQHPLFPFFSFVIPLMKEMLKLFPTDCQIIESISSIYRLTILYSRSVVSEFIPEILKQVAETYSRYPLPQLLQVISAVANSNKLPHIDEKLAESYNITSTTTLNLLRSETKPDSTALLPASHPLREYPIDPNFLLNFSVRPDLTREYFNLIQNALKSSPQCVDQKIVTTMATYIIHNLLDINDLLTSRHCLGFLSTVLMTMESTDPRAARFKDVITELIKNYGVILIRNLLVGITSIFPSNLLPNVAEVFHAYASVFATQFRQEAAKILIKSPFLEGIVEQSDKQIFLNQIQRVKDNKSDYRFAIQAFAILCKGLD